MAVQRNGAEPVGDSVVDGLDVDKSKLTTTVSPEIMTAEEAAADRLAGLFDEHKNAVARHRRGGRSFIQGLTAGAIRS